MEQREHPRIQIPLLVELSHPAVGSVQCSARDISAGGLFVLLPNAQIRVGGKVKIKLLTVLPTDTQPTPTVDLEVKRVTEDGLGLSFKNRTAEHLWASVQRLRNELSIGRDYFQIYQSIALIHEPKGVLLVQENGKWLFPGHYLIVGDEATKSLREYAQSNLGIAVTAKPKPFSVDSSADILVTEAATYSVIFSVEVSEHQVSLSDTCNYKDWRWSSKVKDIREITFASEAQRNAAANLIKQMLEA